METFFNLIQEVQKPGRCHRCGACVTFCNAVNYGALELDEDGKPRYGEIEKCIECGLCYSICPEIDELEEVTRQRVAWSAPMGRVIGTTISRAVDARIRERATDGGVVTALLVHLFEAGRIDGAIVTKPTGPYQRSPWLATSTEEIKDAAGFFFDTSHGMKHLSDAYVTYSTIEEFAPMVRKGLNRVALVGTPCQIKAFRRMEALGIVPSDAIKYCFGLFCSGNFVFGDPQREQLAKQQGFDWSDVSRINVKEEFQLHLKTKEIVRVPLEQLDVMKRHACHYCGDYSAEYADIAFGGIGAPEGWTTIITRTPLGRATLADARGKAIEELAYVEGKNTISEALTKVQAWSARKKKAARQFRREAGKGGVTIAG
jgi:coenzyme F420 hydrogenase subunit beta